MSLLLRSKALVDFLPPSVVFQGDSGVCVSGISSDSRKLAEGDLFIARKGLGDSGAAYIKDAKAKGARAVLTNDAAIDWQPGDLPLALMQDLDRQLSAIAGSFYDSPSSKISVTGITGTNGKTSCCFWYAWLSNELGIACGQIGTLGAGISSDAKKSLSQSLKSTGFTTPDPVQTQALLAMIADSDAAAAVMEVSSHGLDQGRVQAVEFEAAIFTNLTQDHLDYHENMEAYFQAKASLFKRAELRRAVLNRDDHTFDRLAASLSADTQLFTYSLSQSVADLYISQLVWADSGAQVTLDGRWGQAEVLLPVVGDYNLSNVLAVSLALLSSGIALDDLAAKLNLLPSVPGRMQLIVQPGRPRVVVDYAHTPSAVESALAAVRSQVSGELVSVLGCGGDRDKSKRPLMAELALKSSDYCWFTSDNPRSEKPADILADMVDGLSAEHYSLEENRGSAIHLAIMNASAEDLVVVLGKGHEQYQEIKGERIPFDDLEHVKDALSAWANREELN